MKALDNKKQIHLRLRRSTIDNLTNFAAQKGWPINLAADEIISRFFEEQNNAKLK